MHLKVFDRDERYVCNLQNLITAEHEEELNGKDVLTFTIDAKNQNADKLEKKGRVVYKDRLGDWKEFIIQRIEEIHDTEEFLIEVYCESAFYETFGDYIDDKRPYKTTADIALTIALAPTRWEVGRVDNLGISSANFYHISAKEAVHEVARAWGGEIKTRVKVTENKITRRYVDLLALRGFDTGKRYVYGKDIYSIKKTVQEDDVITALYGYGKGEHIEETDGYGRRIDFANIEWRKEKGDPVDKPKGQKWVGLENNKNIWGRNNPDGTKSHVFGKVEFDEIEDPEELLEATWEEYKQRSKPFITYEGRVIDLKEIEGKKHEGVGLGDVVTVIDKEFSPELRLKARVIAHKQDLLNPTNDEIVLGNFIDDITSSIKDQWEFIDQFRGKQGIWDRSQIIGEDGNINAQYLENLIDEMNKRLNSQGGYVYLSEDGKGLTTYNKPIDQNPTMAIQLLGGAFRIANRRKPNGEFDWRTFGDGDGFIADMIVAGTLNASLLKTGIISTPTGNLYMDLDDDVFRFGGGTGDIVEHDNKKSKYIHSDGSYTEINAKGLYRYDANLELEYHHMTKIIKFSAGEDGQAPSTQWIPIGPEFNNKKWTAALSISDSMQASSNEAAIHRIALTQAPGKNPRFRNNQWEVPVMGYKTNYNWKNDSRRFGPVAGIMIITA